MNNEEAATVGGCRAGCVAPHLSVGLRGEQWERGRRPCKSDAPGTLRGPNACGPRSSGRPASLSAECPWLPCCHSCCVCPSPALFHCYSWSYGQVAAAVDLLREIRNVHSLGERKGPGTAWSSGARMTAVADSSGCCRPGRPGGPDTCHAVPGFGIAGPAAPTVELGTRSPHLASRESGGLVAAGTGQPAGVCHTPPAGVGTGLGCKP